MSIKYKGKTVSGGGTQFTTDDTLTMSADNVLSVATPVKAVTQAEFDAMSDEEWAGKMLIVDEPPWQPVSVSIQEYDTDDGWHVRKWSDGHVDMDGSFQHTIAVDDWIAWGSLFTVSASKTPVYKYPLPLTAIYEESFGVTWPIAGSTGITHGNRESNTTTKRYGFMRGTRVASDTTVQLHYHVTGRWK